VDALEQLQQATAPRLGKETRRTSAHGTTASG